MEHPYILDYIKKRMDELGINKYHIETAIVNNTNFGTYGFGATTSDSFFQTELQGNNRYGKYVKEIDGSNNYYYLVEKTIPADIKITSDNGYLLPSESANYSNYTFHNFREFTGQIFITSAAAFQLEFIRVTPYED